MKACRVFVVYMHSLFAQGVVSLLKQHDGLEIVGTESDLQRALDLIRAMRPDVVIVDSKDGNAPFAVNLPELLKDGLKVRVINLHFGDNSMDIYDGRQVYATQPEDLVEAIMAVGVTGEG